MTATSPEWAPFVCARMPEFLQDHAACEKKAAALCMSFISKYPDRTLLIEPMVAVAREELQHFREVYGVIQQQGFSLGVRDQRDDYVNLIFQSLRHGADERFLDRLVMSSLIEARGCERFFLLAEALEDPTLKAFYHRLSKSEQGHYKVFLKVAARYFSVDQIESAVERLALVESNAVRAIPLAARVH